MIELKNAARYYRESSIAVISSCSFDVRAFATNVLQNKTFSESRIILVSFLTDKRELEDAERTGYCECLIYMKLTGAKIFMYHTHEIIRSTFSVVCGTKQERRRHWINAL